ncbi:MAG: PD40 domain-containing protein [Chloroflexi bacterium]|nr:PD40 domain-containing protein [Chloroflexota bacterium]
MYGIEKTPKTTMVWTNGRFPAAALALSLLILLVFSQIASAQFVANAVRVSVGSGGAQSDLDSYFLAVSGDAQVVAFESFNTNWAPDQTEVNFVDIFIHDRTTNLTVKMIGDDSQPADQRSFDPMVSADGRYVSFNSYASNFVPGDTNRHPWVDDGLDVFLYDRHTGQLSRVSLNRHGGQIDGNSVGFISPDARYVIFSSNGDGIVDTNSDRLTAIYVRDLQTGVIERITKGPGGVYPDGVVVGAESSYDGRFIVYASDATNLVPGDSNDVRDIMLYDRVTKETRLISRPVGGGQSSGLSNPARISADGRYIVFRSFASNLVPNDSNGTADIFVYDRISESLEMVSVSSTGQQANAEGKDPAICGDGRYIVFTSEATNLVPIPHNGQRQVFLRDRLTQTTHLVTVGLGGEMGNGRAHRAVLSADCRSVGFATEASNIVPNDTNNARDLFVAELITPANFSVSSLVGSGLMEPGAAFEFVFILRNQGRATPTAVLNNPLPAHVVLVPGSPTNGAVYNAATNTIQWNGVIPAEGQTTFSYRVTIDPALTDFTLITNQATLAGDGGSRSLTFHLPIHGLKVYLPIAARD